MNEKAQANRDYILGDILNRALSAMRDDAKYADEPDASDIECDAPAAIVATESFAEWLRTVDDSDTWVHSNQYIADAIMSRSTAQHEKVRTILESYGASRIPS